ncbi:Phage tail sheath protein [compost metagenome]
MVTPVVMKAEAIAKFREWEDLGLVENIDDFKANLIAERNASDPNRMDMLLPPDLVNQLRIVANKIQFRL